MRSLFSYSYAAALAHHHLQVFVLHDHHSKKHQQWFQYYKLSGVQSLVSVYMCMNGVMIGLYNRCLYCV